MSEERIKTAEERAGEQEPLSAEDLEKISGGTEQLQKAPSHEEESAKKPQ